MARAGDSKFQRLIFAGKVIAVHPGSGDFHCWLQTFSNCLCPARKLFLMRHCRRAARESQHYNQESKGFQGLPTLMDSAESLCCMLFGTLQDRPHVVRCKAQLEILVCNQEKNLSLDECIQAPAVSITLWVDVGCSNHLTPLGL